MKIVTDKESYTIKNDHPYAQAILLLVKSYNQQTTDTWPGDIKYLWVQLNDEHKRIFKLLVKHPEGVSQTLVMKTLKLNWQELRGVLNGITRICNRLGYSTPIQSHGHSAAARKYWLDSSVCKQLKTIQ